MAYAEKKIKPDEIIDLATLTGAVIVSLGDRISGLMGNHASLKQRLLSASRISNEKIWELPLPPEYKKKLRSSVADLKNTMTKTGYAGSLIAGLFLEEFVSPETPWAHIDIAGTAYLSEEGRGHDGKATGVGVRLLIAFLEERIHSEN